MTTKRRVGSAREHRSQAQIRRSAAWRGTRSDTWGAGASAVLVDGSGRRLLQQVTLGHGTTSQSEPLLHFGVGDAEGPFAVEVRWPSGAVSRAQLQRGLHALTEPDKP